MTIDRLRVDADTLEDAVAASLGGDVRIRTQHNVAGGCINRATVVGLSDGRRLFCKANSLEYPGLFEEEARGLLALRAAGGPRVPEVYALFSDGTAQYLLIEWIREGRRDGEFFARFGRAFARMHRGNRSARCGFDRDNHIGATEQRNDWTDDWHAFFAERRLLFQARLARDLGRADAQVAAAVERLAVRLPSILPPPDDGEASILHGDLWGGNYLVDESGEPVLIDPAVYYGHREADLAMTELFGGFGAAFYRSYVQEWPLEPGYDERRDIYNLYHLLNHLNLFGSSYLASCTAILRRYG